MNRRDFKDIATIRLREADVLLKSRNSSGSYYLCGYAVECALKACIAKQTRLFDFPDKKKAADSYSHEVEKLVKIAGLRSALDSAMKTGPTLAGNRVNVKDWNEESRYDRHSQVDAKNLFDAVSDPAHGVLRWIKQHW